MDFAALLALARLLLAAPWPDRIFLLLLGVVVFPR